MNFEICFKITGLYPEERDYIVKQLELIKDKLYDDLNIEYSLLENAPNKIWGDCICEECDSAVQLYSLIDAIKVPNIPTNYEKYIPLNEREIPSIVLKLCKNGNFVDFNNCKEVC